MELAAQEAADKASALLSEPIQLPCPNCGQLLPASIEDLKDGASLPCQGCGRDIQLFRG